MYSKKIEESYIKIQERVNHNLLEFFSASFISSYNNNQAISHYGMLYQISYLYPNH